MSADNKINLGILDKAIGFHINLAYSASHNHFARILGADTLKPGSFAVMTLIHENPGITQVDLARTSGRDKSSITAALRNLEDAGLIRRDRLEDDRRSYASTLTEEGEKAYTRILDKAKIHIDAIDHLIGEEKKKDLINALRKISQMS
ncbi:MarR family winged helix-turn-helix transcriptional regulator [Nitratireductor pacificus]|uniref:MarR family transcriptional regulator n=1 Tax=Nitratireductor pacificus pht-3B TaxID=391937 RepID=K2N5B5_9HYPH|nr:MarR family transcriptional regulator [Nitratireductor pacificus]EKF19413.1 MarR family transcriptional regulator [Nitratireductor pacificus pht-3B]